MTVLQGDTNGDRVADFAIDLTGNIALRTSDLMGLATIGSPARQVSSDFNGDGTSDVMWRNHSTGHVGWWEMHNGTATWRSMAISGLDYKAVGIGDFNGDGTSDILWRMTHLAK